MRLLRVTLAAALIATAGYAIRSVAWKPYRCDVEKHRVQRVLLSVFDREPTHEILWRTRAGVADIRNCIEISPTDADLYMTAAVQDRILSRLDHAEQMYEAALRIDPRPEIYLNLGLIQLQQMERDKAFENLTRACLFNINYINEIPDLNDRATVQAAVDAAHARGVMAAHANE